MPFSEISDLVFGEEPSRPTWSPEEREPSKKESLKERKERVRQEKEFRAEEEKIKKDWIDFYKRNFDREIDLSEEEIGLSDKEDNEQYSQILIIDPTLSEEEIYQKCRAKFPCRREIEESFDTSLYPEKTFSSFYCVRVEGRQEAAEGKPEQPVHVSDSISLREYLLFSLKYFEETGELLDQKGKTVVNTHYKWKWNPLNLEVATVGGAKGEMVIGHCKDKPEALAKSGTAIRPSIHPSATT